MEPEPASPPALYDDPDFFAAYDEMRKQNGTLNAVVETPALISLLPVVSQAVAADLGCGAGAMCRWLADHGAASVTGYDASARMLAAARQHRPAATSIAYEQAELDRLQLPQNHFTLIISGLVLHYVADFPRLARQVAAALRPGGSFIFSVEHPVITCHLRAWALAADGTRAHWPVDRYLETGPRTINWLGFHDVPRHHRTVADYVNTMLDAGLVLRRLLEPGPTDSDIATWPGLADQRRRPPFLIIRADRPA